MLIGRSIDYMSSMNSSLCGLSQTLFYLDLLCLAVVRISPSCKRWLLYFWDICLSFPSSGSSPAWLRRSGQGCLVGWGLRSVVPSASLRAGKRHKNVDSCRKQCIHWVDTRLSLKWCLFSLLQWWAYLYFHCSPWFWRIFNFSVELDSGLEMENHSGLLVDKHI